jgi:hypothetical protein
MVKALKPFPDICLISGICCISCTVTALHALNKAVVCVSVIRTEFADKEAGEKDTRAEEIRCQ